MKIVLVQSRVCFGGAEHVGVMLANALAEYHDVVLATNTQLEVSYAISDSVKVRNIFPSIPHGVKKWTGAIQQLRKLFVQEKPDVAIGILSTCSFICKVAGVGLGIPVVATEHDAFERPESAPMSRGNAFSKFWLNRLFDVVTVLTKADKQVIGNRLRRVVVMSNPLSLQPATVESRNEFKDAEGNTFAKKPIVLAAGRLDSWHYKGFDVLLEAWAKVLARCKENIEAEGWRLCIAGKDEADGLSHLQSLVRKLELGDSVSFLGFRKDMVRLYQEASVFALSSRCEGFGLVLVEAMSQGCACVATDYKGRQKEIFGDAECGLLCPPEDAEALAEALQSVMTDATLRHRLQKNAIERSRFFMPLHIVKLWEQLLSEVVAARKK